MRFVIDGTRVVFGPLRETNPYLIQQYGPFKLDENGNIQFAHQAQSFGHWIGSNHRRTMKVGHYGKPVEYYKRRNTPKHLRGKFGTIAVDVGYTGSANSVV